MIIRKGQIDDLPEIQQLFVDTIKEICQTDYNNEQIRVWTFSIENKQRWMDILTKQFVLIAQDANLIVGFCTLDKGNYIDFLYVHKDHQRQGIAHNLYTFIEKEAIKQGQTYLTSDVSKTARPFFEKIGFILKAEQTIERQGIKLTNYKMIKTIKTETAKV